MSRHRGEHARALQLFEEALAFRQTQPRAKPARIAQWCVAKRCVPWQLSAKSGTAHRPPRYATPHIS